MSKQYKKPLLNERFTCFYIDISSYGKMYIYFKLKVLIFLIVKIKTVKIILI